MLHQILAAYTLDTIFKKYFLLQPISEWTNSNVVEWMAAANLYTYSDVFRCKDIKGADLINLDREKLIVSSRLYVYVVF